MTTPVPANSHLDAPALVGTGVDAAAQNADRLGITWGLSLATVLVGNTDTSSSNVTVVADGDAAGRQLTIPLIKRRPVYGQIEAPRALRPGDRVAILSTPTGVLAMPVSPDQEVDQVAPGLFLFDDFNRPPQDNGWGDPNYGPAWIPTFGSSGITVGGAYIGPGNALVMLSENPPNNFSMWLINVRPAVLPDDYPSSGFGALLIKGRNELPPPVSPEDDSDGVGLNMIYVPTQTGFTGDVTGVRPWIKAKAAGQGFAGFNNSWYVLGDISNPSVPIDIYITAVGATVNIWTALTSNGINISAPFNFTTTTINTDGGSVYLRTWSGGDVPLLIGGIIIRGL